MLARNELEGEESVMDQPDAPFFLAIHIGAGVHLQKNDGAKKKGSFLLACYTISLRRNYLSLFQVKMLLGSTALCSAQPYTLC